MDFSKWPPDILHEIEYVVFSHLENKISPGVIWYFEPHGKLNPGSIYIHGILNPLTEN